MFLLFLPYFFLQYISFIPGRNPTLVFFPFQPNPRTLASRARFVNHLRNHLAELAAHPTGPCIFWSFCFFIPLFCLAAAIGTSCLLDGCDAAKVLLECAYEWGIPHIPCADKSRGDGAIPRDFDTLIANATMAQRGVTTGHGCFGAYIPFLYTRHVAVLFLSRLVSFTAHP